MAKKPKLEVTHVWVVLRVQEYDGAEVEAVVFDVDKFMESKKNLEWTTHPVHGHWEAYLGGRAWYVIEKFQIQ